MYKIFEELLRKRGVTAYQVAKATGISSGSLSDWKNGRSSPKTAKLQKIADYFGVTVDYLLGNEPKEASAQAPGHDILDDVDLAFFGEFRKLSEDDKDAVRDFVKVMQERRARKKQE